MSQNLCFLCCKTRHNFLSWICEIYVYVTKFFHISSHWTEVNASLHLMSEQNMDTSAFLVQNCSVCSLVCSSRTHNNRWEELSSKLIPKYSSCRHYYPQMVKSLKDLGNVEKKTDRGRPKVSEQMVRAANSYFCKHPKGSWKQLLPIQGLLLLHTEHPEKRSSQVPVQPIRSASVFIPRVCPTSRFFSMLYGKNVVQLKFTTSNCFFWLMCLSLLWNCTHSEHLYLRHVKSKRNSTKRTTHKVTVSCAVLRNVVVAPIPKWWNKVDNYQIPDRWVWSRAQYFPQNAVFQQHEAFLQNSCAIHFLLIEMFTNS